MAEETYRRGQVVWALWGSFGPAGRAHPKPPPAFLSRVRKFGALGVPLDPKERPGQPGIDAAYTPYHAFELMVALDLQDAVAVPQSAVAFFVRAMRPRLHQAYRRIMQRPPAPRQSIAATDLPHGPSRDGVADTGCYLVFRYVEIKEAWPKPALDASSWKGKPQDHPLFMSVEFLFGRDALMKTMDWLAGSGEDRSRIVIELSNIAVIVDERLRAAPAIKRGRT